MNIKRLLKITTLALCLCLIVGVGSFIYNANHQYKINAGFTSLPLKFNADESSSSYTWQNVDITVHGGFIKGIQLNDDKSESIVIRALSPLPTVKLKGNTSTALLISIENINPDFYAESISGVFNPTRTAVNTLRFSIDINAGEEKNIEPRQSDFDDNNTYIILGDNRDGYDTFAQIIEQVNALNPVFVIDNGDLVYSGKPNQYRLFDQSIKNISSTVCTTLGNHDVRSNGRDIYTKLYGPGYYSFDFGDSHFAFLDSSPGWAEKRAITDEQYEWLERDLQKAQGKRIYVITHIPPTDPRRGTTSNEIQLYIDEIKNNNIFENLLDNYSASMSMNHGFQDKEEAKRFETLMAEYGVETVYLSHIHSYFDYTKNGVHYIITGGAGAELLTKNSYYHYMIAKFIPNNALTIVQLSSPANALLTRYEATITLFAKSIYVENKTAVIFFIAGAVLFAILLITFFILKYNHELSLLWILINDSGKYVSKRVKELFRENK